MFWMLGEHHQLKTKAAQTSGTRSPLRTVAFRYHLWIDQRCLLECTYYLFQKSLQLVRNLTRIDLGILYFPELVQQILFIGTSGQQREVVEWYLGKGSPDLVDVPFGATVARFLLLKSRKKDMTILILMMIFCMRGHENLWHPTKMPPP